MASGWRAWGTASTGGWATPPEKVAEAMAATRQLLQVVRDLPEVESVAAALTGPFVSGMRNTQKSDGDEIPVLGRGLVWDIDQVTDDFVKVFGLQVVRGRWFGRQDDGQSYWPVVINEKMARDFFGDADPVGQADRDGQQQAGAGGGRDRRLPADEGSWRRPSVTCSAATSPGIRRSCPTRSCS